MYLAFVFKTSEIIYETFLYIKPPTVKGRRITAQAY